MSDRRDLLIEIDGVGYQPSNESSGWSQYSDWVGTDGVDTIRVWCQAELQGMYYYAYIQEVTTLDVENPAGSGYRIEHSLSIDGTITEIPLTLRWFRFALVYQGEDIHEPSTITYSVVARAIA